MELWLLFGVLGYTIGAVASTVDKYMMNQRYHPVTTSWLRTLFNGLMLGAVGLLFFDLRISPSLLLLASIPALFLAVNFVIFFRVFHRKNASEIIPFFQSFDVLFIFFGSVFFLQETVTWENYFGILLILCGIYLVLTVRVFKVPQLDRSFLLIAALIPLDVTSALLIKWYLGNAEPIALVVSIQMMAFLILGSILLITQRFIQPTSSYVRPRARNVLVASLFASTAAVFLYTALSSANASNVYPLAGVSTITIFILSILFLKEKSYPHRFIGILIVFFGIYLISL